MSDWECQTTIVSTVKDEVENGTTQEETGMEAGRRQSKAKKGINGRGLENTSKENSQIENKGSQRNGDTPVTRNSGGRSRRIWKLRAPSATW